MCMYINTKTDVAQNLWLSEDLPIGRILTEKKYGGTGLISQETEVLYVKLNQRAEAATGSYSVTGESKNHRNIPSRCF